MEKSRECATNTVDKNAEALSYFPATPYDDYFVILLRTRALLAPVGVIISHAFYFRRSISGA